MGLCGSSEVSGERKKVKKDFADLHGLNTGINGHVVYLPTSGPLTAKDYKERLTSSDGTQTAYFPKSGYNIRYAFVSQRGYYPDSPNKANQVCVFVFV